MRYICPQGCIKDVGMSKGHPGECPEGHGTFRYEKELKRESPLRRVSEKREPAARKRGTNLRRSRGFQASPAQRAKVEGCVCIRCKRDYYEEGAEIQAAHVYPRRLATCDCADGVVPMCASCHRHYDDQNRPLDLMPALIDGGYRKEIVHAFAEHDAPLGEVLRIITGSEWKPAELGEAA